MRALLKTNRLSVPRNSDHHNYTSYVLVTYVAGALDYHNQSTVIKLTDDLNSFEDIRDWIHARTGGINRVFEVERKLAGGQGSPETPNGTTAMLCLVIYERDLLNGDVDEALMITERNPGVRFTVAYKLERELMARALDEHGITIHLIDGAWVLNGYESTYFTYDPKKARTITKQRVRAALNKKSGKKRSRKLDQLAYSHFKGCYCGMWSAITESNMFSKHMLSGMHSVYNSNFGRHNYCVPVTDVVAKTLGLERIVKKLFGKMIVHEKVYDLCVRIQEQFFSHKPKDELKAHEIKLGKFTKRVIKAGVTKGGTW